MAIDPSVVINIAAQWTGSKEFKKADTATDRLNKNVKNLGKTLGVAFSVGAVLAFGKASVKASLDAQAQQDRLASLLKVTVGATNSQIEALNREAEALARVGVVSKDNVTQTQSQLATFNLQINTIKKLTPAILDYVTAEKGANASASDFKSMTNGLAQALNGNFAALTAVGFVLDENTKKQISSGTEAERAAAIVKVLNGTYKDFNKNLAKTPAGQMQILANAADNAKEIIGGGLLESLKILTGSIDIQNLAVNIEAFATRAAEGFKKLAGFIKENLTLLKVTGAVLATMFVATNVVMGIAALITAIGTLRKAFTALRATAIATAIAGMFAVNPLGAAAAALAMVAVIGGTLKAVDLLTSGYNAAADAGSKIFPVLPFSPLLTQAKETAKIAKADAEARKKAQEAAAKAAREAAALQKKTSADALKAAKLKLAVDKATLALGKGSDVFDLEKIQLAAAEKNQAQQLGKITSEAQLMQITNDLARLQVKKSILALEEAIATQDVAAITNATNKLNADLKVLGALTNQKVKLSEIDDILKGILPKDLINIKNLQEAIDLLKIIGGGPSMATHAIPILGDPNKSPAGIPSTGGVYGKTTPYAPSPEDLARIYGVIPSNIPAGAMPTPSGSFLAGISGGAASSTNTYNITVQAGIGDPNAIAEAIDQVLTDAVQRGTLRSLATA
jgi:hypothetical protein